MHPIFRWFNRRTRFPKLAALLTLISFVIILCVPLYFVGDVVLKQSHSMYAWIISHGSIETITQNISNHLHELFPTLSFNVQDHVNSAISALTAGIGSLFTATVATLISFVLMLLSMFYFLKDGAAWKEALIQLSPLSLESNVTIVATLRKTITGIFKGYFTVGLAQGITTGIGLYLFHVPHPALWGLLAVFTSFVPTIGSSLIAIPSALFLFAVGRTGAGIGYAIWAVAFSVTIDNVLSPLCRWTTNIHSSTTRLILTVGRRYPHGTNRVRGRTATDQLYLRVDICL